MNKILIPVAVWLLVALAVLAAPFYALWVLGGYCADRIGQHRSAKT